MAKQSKKSRAITRWISRNQWKHFCHCGCGEYIVVERAHFKPSKGGVPRYIPGHNLRPVDPDYTPPEKPNPWELLPEEEKQRRLAALTNFEKGDKNPAWKGGRWQNEHGYVMVLCPDHPFSKEGYVLEHRLVVEERTRREDPDNFCLVEVAGQKYLNSTCVVHHIDEVKYNNDSSNLMLLPNSNSHSLIHHSPLPMNERLKRIAMGIYHSRSLSEEIPILYPWILSYINKR